MGWPQFSNLFLLDRRQHALVSHCLCLLGGRVALDFSFRRNLMDSEVADFTLMLGFLRRFIFLLENQMSDYGNLMSKVNSRSNPFIMC